MNMREERSLRQSIWKIFALSVLMVLAIGLLTPAKAHAETVDQGTIKMNPNTTKQLTVKASGEAGIAWSSSKDTICSAIMKCGEGILKPATVRLMTTVPEENDPKVGRALGWDTKNDFTICHTGYTGTSVEIDLKNHTAIILLTNRVHPEDKGSVRDLRLKVSGIVASSLNEDK